MRKGSQLSQPRSQKHEEGRGNARPAVVGGNGGAGEESVSESLLLRSAGEGYPAILYLDMRELRFDFRNGEDYPRGWESSKCRSSSSNRLINYPWKIGRSFIIDIVPSYFVLHRTRGGSGVVLRGRSRIHNSQRTLPRDR